MARSIPADQETATDVADLLHGLAHRLRREARDDLPDRVTWGQVRALRTVARAGRPMRMSELADALHVARRSATSVVDDLERHGLVARGRDGDDRRAVTVTLTDRGHATLGELREGRRAAARRVLDRLTDAELTTLRDLLARLDP